MKCGHLSTFPTYTVLGKLKVDSKSNSVLYKVLMVSFIHYVYNPVRLKGIISVTRQLQLHCILFFLKQMNKKCQPVFISGDLCVLYEEELGSSFNRLKINQTEKRNLRN